MAANNAPTPKSAGTAGAAGSTHDTAASGAASRPYAAGTPNADCRIHAAGAPRIARYGTPEASGLDPRYVIGKPHPDRARQFVPFMALKGYHDLVANADLMEGVDPLIYERDFLDDAPQDLPPNQPPDAPSN